MTLKRNFCFYIRKTGRQTQGLKKLGMRSSQKMGSPVPVPNQFCPSVKPVLSQCQTCPVMPCPGVNSDCHSCASNGTSLHNSDFIRKTELWEHLPMRALAWFLTWFNSALLTPQICVLVFLPVFFLFQKCLSHFTF